MNRYIHIYFYKYFRNTNIEIVFCLCFFNAHNLKKNIYLIHSLRHSSISFPNTKFYFQTIMWVACMVYNTGS